MEGEVRSAAKQVRREEEEPAGGLGSTMSVRIRGVVGWDARRAEVSSWPMKPAAPVMRMDIVAVNWKVKEVSSVENKCNFLSIF